MFQVVLIQSQKKRIKKIKKGILTYKEALKYEKEIRDQIQQNKIVTRTKITINQIWNLYKIEIEEHHKISYISTQTYNYGAHIEPYFKEIDIQKLKREHIKDFQEYLLARKLSPNTTNKIIILLKNILDIGIEQNLLSTNPVAGLKKLTIEKKKMDFWTLDEFKTFISLIEDSEQNYKTFFLTLYFTGMRLGEILALNWNDIDFSTCEINVTKTFHMLKGEAKFTSPKTKYSNRQISINKSLLKELKKWKLEQDKLLKKYLLTPDNTNQVFQESPHYMTKDHIYKKYKKNSITRT
ncbi:site-specific recombinase, phage integrase family protein [Listeria floridensis FSL S10-1187]|uniref:Site-specific recombinase, phage integrase family protein n=1 Tax=Listeria floridensis FSL S10-1187 TaxID=1265817 RepID=A0ABN0RGZ5_9LIST|nr:tyrosine-type recombinase/integrase [Listeria floridensis]EUJ33119.1 site-specific recombinase, phage integrase family protein [Listeria floridensis FSL S10-1187]